MKNKNLTWDDIHDLYPVNKNLIWLNNSGVSPCGIHISNAIKDYIAEYSNFGIMSLKYPLTETITIIQSILSGLFNCNKDEIAVIHNTNEGMSLISYGLDLKNGDEIIILENEYPSNVYPWEHWKIKGIKIKFINSGSCEDEFIENFKKEINDKTKVVSISSVHWCTGMALPLKEIGKICAEKNIFFIVDGAQGAGHVKIDVKNFNIDFMALSAWKWLLGPLGLGVLFIKQENIDKINFIFKGTNSVVNDHEYLPYKNKVKPNASRYMSSTISYLNVLYFKTSLELLDNIGFDNVMERLYFLSGKFTDILKELGFKVLNDGYKTKTGIILANKSGLDTNDLSKKLKEKNIIAPARLNNLRISPHIYISEKEINDFGKILKDCI